MHINVSDILTQSLGYNRTYNITGERPQLEAVSLVNDIEGEISIARLENGLLVTGRLSTAIELECHRCLQTFTKPVVLKLSQVFTEKPVDDEHPIEGTSIDLAPLVGQEILLSLPIKILHAEDCKGIEDATSLYTKKDNTSSRLGDQARITKGP